MQPDGMSQPSRDLLFRVEALGFCHEDFCHVLEVLETSHGMNDHCKDQEISCRYFRVLVGMGLSENGVPHIFIFTDKNLYIPIHIALSETRVPYNSMVSHHLFRLNPLFSIIENMKLSKLKLIPMLKLLFNIYMYIYSSQTWHFFTSPM